MGGYVICFTEFEHRAVGEELHSANVITLDLYARPSLEKEYIYCNGSSDDKLMQKLYYLFLIQ